MLAIHYVVDNWIFQKWRERTGNKPEKEQVDELAKALSEIDRNDLLTHIGRS